MGEPKITNIYDSSSQFISIDNNLSKDVNISQISVYDGDNIVNNIYYYANIDNENLNRGFYSNLLLDHSNNIIYNEGIIKPNQQLLLTNINRLPNSSYSLLNSSGFDISSGVVNEDNESTNLLHNITFKHGGWNSPQGSGIGWPGSHVAQLTDGISPANNNEVGQSNAVAGCQLQAQLLGKNPRITGDKYSKLKGGFRTGDNANSGTCQGTYGINIAPWGQGDTGSVNPSPWLSSAFNLFNFHIEEILQHNLIAGKNKDAEYGSYLKNKIISEALTWNSINSIRQNDITTQEKIFTSESNSTKSYKNAFSAVFNGPLGDKPTRKPGPSWTDSVFYCGPDLPSLPQYKEIEHATGGTNYEGRYLQFKWITSANHSGPGYEFYITRENLFEKESADRWQERTDLNFNGKYFNGLMSFVTPGGHETPHPVYFNIPLYALHRALAMGKNSAITKEMGQTALYELAKTQNIFHIIWSWQTGTAAQAALWNQPCNLILTHNPTWKKPITDLITTTTPTQNFELHQWGFPGLGLNGYEELPLPFPWNPYPGGSYNNGTDINCESVAKCSAIIKEAGSAISGNMKLRNREILKEAFAIDKTITNPFGYGEQVNKDGVSRGKTAIPIKTFRSDGNTPSPTPNPTPSPTPNPGDASSSSYIDINYLNNFNNFNNKPTTIALFDNFYNYKNITTSMSKQCISNGYIPIREKQLLYPRKNTMLMNTEYNTILNYDIIIYPNTLINIPNILDDHWINIKENGKGLLHINLKHLTEENNNIYVLSNNSTKINGNKIIIDELYITHSSTDEGSVVFIDENNKPIPILFFDAHHQTHTGNNQTNEVKPTFSKKITNIELYFDYDNNINRVNKHIEYFMIYYEFKEGIRNIENSHPWTFNVIHNYNIDNKLRNFKTNYLDNTHHINYESKNIIVTNVENNIPNTTVLFNGDNSEVVQNIEKHYNKTNSFTITINKTTIESENNSLETDYVRYDENSKQYINDVYIVQTHNVTISSAVNNNTYTVIHRTYSKLINDNFLLTLNNFHTREDGKKFPLDFNQITNAYVKYGSRFYNLMRFIKFNMVINTDILNNVGVINNNYKLKIKTFYKNKDTPSENEKEYKVLTNYIDISSNSFNIDLFSEKLTDKNYTNDWKYTKWISDNSGNSINRFVIPYENINDFLSDKLVVLHNSNGDKIGCGNLIPIIISSDQSSHNIPSPFIPKNDPDEFYKPGEKIAFSHIYSMTNYHSHQSLGKIYLSHHSKNKLLVDYYFNNLPKLSYGDLHIHKGYNCTNIESIYSQIYSLAEDTHLDSQTDNENHHSNIYYGNNPITNLI